MMDPGAPAMEQEHGDMKFMGRCAPSMGGEMEMSAEKSGGMQSHNAAKPEQPKNMRFLTK